MSTQFESVDVLHNEHIKHVMDGKDIKQENPEIKMAENGIEEELNSIDNNNGIIDTEIVQITMRMAKMWEGKGHTYEAMDLYKKVLKRYKDSNEAKEAKNALIAYAKRFETEGRYHLAQSLYDELFL